MIALGSWDREVVIVACEAATESAAPGRVAPVLIVTVVNVLGRGTANSGKNCCNQKGCFEDHVSKVELGEKGTDEGLIAPRIYIPHKASATSSEGPKICTLIFPHQKPDETTVETLWASFP